MTHSSCLIRSKSNWRILVLCVVKTELIVLIVNKKTKARKMLGHLSVFWKHFFWCKSVLWAVWLILFALRCWKVKQTVEKPKCPQQLVTRSHSTSHFTQQLIPALVSSCSTAELLHSIVLVMLVFWGRRARCTNTCCAHLWFSYWHCTSPACASCWATVLWRGRSCASGRGWLPARGSEPAHLQARWPSSPLWCCWAGCWWPGDWHEAPRTWPGTASQPRRCSCVWSVWWRCSPQGTHG